MDVTGAMNVKDQLEGHNTVVSLRALKSHDAYINLRDFRAVKKFEQSHPELYIDATEAKPGMDQVELMGLQMHAFN